MNKVDMHERAHALGAAYRAAFQACPVFCLVTDERAVVIDANRTAVAFFNVPLRVIVGKPLLFFVARRDTRAFREHVRDLSGEDLEPIVVQLRPRGGSPHPMRLVIERVHSLRVWVAQPEEADGRESAPRVAQAASYPGEEGRVSGRVRMA